MTLQDLTAAFAHEYAQRPIPAQGPIDTSPIDTTPDTDEFDAIWQHVIPETRARGNVCFVNSKSAIKAIRIRPLWQVFLPKWR